MSDILAQAAFGLEISFLDDDKYVDSQNVMFCESENSFDYLLNSTPIEMYDQTEPTFSGVDLFDQLSETQNDTERYYSSQNLVLDSVSKKKLKRPVSETQTDTERYYNSENLAPDSVSKTKLKRPILNEMQRLNERDISSVLRSIGFEKYIPQFVGKFF